MASGKGANRWLVFTQCLNALLIDVTDEYHGSLRSIESRPRQKTLTPYNLSLFDAVFVFKVNTRYASSKATTSHIPTNPEFGASSCYYRTSSPQLFVHSEISNEFGEQFCKHGFTCPSWSELTNVVVVFNEWDHASNKMPLTRCLNWLAPYPRNEATHPSTGSVLKCLLGWKHLIHVHGRHLYRF